MAFTVSDDHRQQEKVWAARPKWGVDPDDIRATLTEQHISADGKLAKFVGIKSYEKAGGAVLRDLFDDENAGWLTDPDLLHRLAMDRLVKAQAALIEDGWKWAEIMPDTHPAQGATGIAARSPACQGSRPRYGEILETDRRGLFLAGLERPHP
jgi:hypothetical protein